MKRAKEPWKKAAPKSGKHTKLTSKSRKNAKATARRAGRKYPNLVDNINAAKKQRSRKASS
jgi:hypothetical protein